MQRRSAPIGSGGITVHLDGLGSADLLIDVNGYYSNTPASGDGFDIYANTGGYALVVSNTSTSCSGTCAALVSDNSDSNTTAMSVYTWSTIGVNTGIKGEAYGISGSHGVLGIVDHPIGQSSGVEGTAGGPVDNHWAYSGVRGISSNFGVLGISTTLGVGGFEEASGGGTLSGSYLGYTSNVGLYTLGDTGATGTKGFVEPHPTDATKAIRFISLEGNEAGTYFRGKGRFSGRSAVISVPEEFRFVTEADGLSIQVTPIGDFASVAVVDINLDTIQLKSTRDVEFYYTVNGVRKGYGDIKVIESDAPYFVPDSPDATMPGAFSPEQRRKLIATGVYNEDGTVNMQTAERVGWVRMWQERAEKARADAALRAQAMAGSKP